MNDHVEKPIEWTLKAAREFPSVGSEPDAPVFDQGVFDELREMLSAETVAILVTKLAVHLRRVFTPDLLRTADAARLASEAHKMVSMAGMMGFARLSALCAALERACGEGLARDGLIARVDQARDDVLTRIARLHVV